LIVVSCLTVPTAPHDGHTGGGVDFMELSGKPQSYTHFSVHRRRLARPRAIQLRCVMFRTGERVTIPRMAVSLQKYVDFVAFLRNGY
jgi:hypothetical protein